MYASSVVKIVYDVLRAISTPKNIWVPKRDSNPQPSDRRWDALTIELLGLS